MSVKQEIVDSTKIKTPFGMVKPTVKKDEDKPVTKISLKPVEKKKSTDKVVEDKKSQEASPVKIKKESPEKKSPPVATLKPTTSNNGKKGAKTPVQKGSISSFFSKPSTSTKSANYEKKEEKQVVKREPSPKVQEEEMEVEPSPRKRSASPTPKSQKDITKKQPQKKLKLKEPQNKKRSRIQVMEDSSEEEHEERSILDEPESKLIKFDREETPEPPVSRSRSPTPEEKPLKAENPSGKHKAKRWVTKRFETDDGFIRTEKVLEEYSASEDETVNDENRKKNSPPAAKPAAPVQKSPEKKSTAAAKGNGNVKAKQGSIMSFFTKK